MLQHYLTIIYRNFLRAKGYFLINLSGLAAGMTCTLLIYLWVQDELAVNRFHSNDRNLYQVMENQNYTDRLLTTTSTPGILAENLKIDYPEIEHAATTTWIGNYTLTIADHNVKAKGFYVGPEFFELFSYKLIAGAPNKVLADKLSIVICKSLAVRLFGTEKDVTGKTVELNHEKSYTVTGVFEDVPNASSSKFEFVLSFETFKDENNWVTQWDNNGPSTYIALKDGTNAQEFERKIVDYIKGKFKDSRNELFLAKYADRYLYGTYENGKQSGGRIVYVKLFSVIAIFILVIACINFMNLSTARATRKSKEVGIKKSVGAARQTLIAQYMSESLITSLLALILAVGLVYLLLPSFNTITEKQIDFNIYSVKMLLSLLGVAIVTGILAGSYPALYLSGFKPAAVLKGDMKGSIGEMWARKGLVVFQFFLSVILIVSVIVIYKQIQFVQTQNLGYEKDHLIMFPREGKLWKDTQTLETFLAEVRRVPGVKSTASIGHGLLGQNSNTSGLQWEGKDPDDRILFENASATYGTLETLGVTIVEGRGFIQDNIADTSKILFNEAGIKAMGLTDPVGKHIRLWDTHDMEIVGVIKDFHFQSMHEPVKPLFFRYNPDNAWNIMVRLEPGKEKDALARIGEFYNTYNPGFSFEYKFQDQEYARLYAAEQRVASLATYFATMAVLISCLGLFGLAAFTAERRLKEIGIRKALGSSSTNIVLLLSGDFTRMVLVSVILGLPVAYWLLDLWLAKFAFRIPLSWVYFGLSGAIALGIAWVTVASQAVKASRVNPVKCLRSE